MSQSKILFYISGLNVGGAETFILNLLSEIDPIRFHIDFCLQQKTNRNKRLLSLIEKLGCKIFIIPSFAKHYNSSKKNLRKILIENSYDFIHIHANSLINYSPVSVARKLGVKTIVHSHNSSNAQGGLLGRLIHNFNSYRLRKCDVIRISCGKEAGLWMFGKCSFTVIPNGVNSSQYKFSLTDRAKIRAQYKIDDNTVLLGHVGRFSQQKNHKFLIDVAKKLYEKDFNFKLILVGDGELKPDIEEAVKQNNLNDVIIFANNQEKVWEYYSAFDLLVFPSLYEGLPFTLIEAQASGLPVFSSNVVSVDTKITDLITFLPFSADEWTSKIEAFERNIDNRFRYAQQVEESKFSSRHMLQKMEEIYVR